MLEYTRLEVRERRTEAIDLNDELKLLRTEFQLTLDECGGRIEFGVLPSIHGDPAMLTELFQNLIGNALKFRGDDPPVVRITARQVDNEWHISVSDNGIGIDSKFHDQIFKPLRRLNPESAYEGFGVGLATCQRIIEKHAGRIRVESQPGQGSTFHVILPASED